jgi:hypothetical protein
MVAGHSESVNESGAVSKVVRQRFGLRAPARGRVLAVGYLAVVAVLAADAFSDPHAGFTWRTGAAMLLTLPAMVAALPVLYVVGAATWNATHAADGGPMWPVTLIYTVIFVGIAAANVWLVATALRRRRAVP